MKKHHILLVMLSALHSGPSAGDTTNVAGHIAGDGWKGIEATTTCDVWFEESGFYAGHGKCFQAIISDGDRFIIADTQGFIGNDENTMKVFRSIKFLK